MASASHRLTEEELQCCICLEVFKEPVTLPCGHNFCKNCITEHLNRDANRQCPLCKESVHKSHKLVVNTFISEVAVKFRGESRERPGGASAGNKQAILFCLLALGLAGLIYYALDLLDHETVSSIVFPQQSDVANNMCPEHGRPLELYCRNEQMPICQSCADSSHKFHTIVPLEEEYEMRKAELSRTEAEITQKILERQVRNEEIKHWILMRKEAADRGMAAGVELFASLQKTQEELLGKMDAQQKTIETQAKGFTDDLEGEITELAKRRSRVQQLLGSKGHIHLVQNFPSVKTVPPTKDLPKLSSFDDGVQRTALEVAVNQFKETLRNKLEKMQEAELKSIRWTAVDVTLDPNTAYPGLVLSDDGKQVHSGGVPDNLKRYHRALYVLGKQSLCSGRFYYDVQVKGKGSWIIGVIRESAYRKGDLQLNPENDIWALFRGPFGLIFPAVWLLVTKQTERLRVFVDYEGGVVSFYDIDSATLIYTYTKCSFTEKLYPLFGLIGSDSVPLIIPPVLQ